MRGPKNLHVRKQWGIRALTPIFFLLASCSVIDHKRIEGWPELQIVEHRVPAEEMVSRCQKYTGAASLPLACERMSEVRRLQSLYTTFMQYSKNHSEVNHV